MQANFYTSVTREVPNIPYAHFALPSYAEGTPCVRLHGHSGKAVVTVSGFVNPESPFLVEFSHLKQVIQSLVDTWDHRLLVHWSSAELDSLWSGFSGEIKNVLSSFGITKEGLVPLGVFSTSENLAREIAIHVFKTLWEEGNRRITQVTVEFWESPSSNASVTVVAVKEGEGASPTNSNAK